MNINLTLIGQSITFLFFVWFCHAFVWGAIRKAMEEREKQIADGLDAADRAGRDLELAQEKAAKQLREAKAKLPFFDISPFKLARKCRSTFLAQARMEGCRHAAQ